MKSCLIVDDSKIVRKFARRIIEELNILVTEAGDGIEALAECEKSPPDVILLDWNMPNMDGMQFLVEFRNKKHWDHVLIIFCTTINDISSIQDAMNAGANEHIMKPFDIAIVKSKFIQMGLIN